ncbi:MAG: nucleotide-disulfide oxidoreductase [Rhodospirillaceae bacterium]|jgi:NADH dehydrogenase|nr:nucleotide-disulfide oxidoreductase [Rhodospirillaceae bacterium]HAL47955.1 nucleotide-disulfide oxidoreductase [Dehalococcoidia bacterium]
MVNDALRKPVIVILGGGFAGVFAAKSLKRRLGWDAEIELINDANYFVFQPLLPGVAGGGITSSDAVTPLRAMLKDIHIRMAEVFDIDLAAKEIIVVQGTKRRLIPLAYDHLVIALGQKVDLSRVPGLAEHAFTMKNLGDAHRLRNHVIDCLEHADVTQDPKLKRELLTFVVAGAGFSGVETVGEMKDLIDRSLKFYPNIEREEIRVLLIEFSDRILQQLPPDLAEYASQQLRKRGIEILLETEICSATGSSIETTDDRIFGTKTIVATIGNTPHPLVMSLDDLPKDKGKIAVDRFLRVSGVDSVWAIGDLALIPLVEEPEEYEQFAPPTAQFAVREGGCVARNIARTILGGDLIPFSYESKGAMASLGGRRAVAQVYGIRMSGMLAWFLWRAFYLSFLPGGITRVRVLVNWIMDAVLPRNTVQVQQAESQSTRYVHFRKGDEVFEPGMLADGFYVVLSGSFELKIEDPSAEEPVIRTLGPGDHFGERVIFGDGLRTGSVRALDASLALVVNREDFERFAGAFKVLGDYFSDYIPKTFPISIHDAGNEPTSESTPTGKGSPIPRWRKPRPGNAAPRQ